MLMLASQFRKLGFVLIAFGMISLALVGGTFSHAHEVSVEHSHSDHSHAGHDHHDGGQSDDNSIHCGAQILTLAMVPGNRYALPKGPHDQEKALGLRTLTFTPDPPPPRSA